MGRVKSRLGDYVTGELPEMSFLCPTKKSAA
jgi:hypothetical protein